MQHAARSAVMKMPYLSITADQVRRLVVYCPRLGCALALLRDLPQPRCGRRNCPRRHMFRHAELKLSTSNERLEHLRLRRLGDAAVTVLQAEVVGRSGVK